MGGRNVFGWEILFRKHAEISLRGPQDAGHALLDECKIQEDVEMYTQLPDYDDFRRFDLPRGNDLTVIAYRIYGGFAKQPWLTPRHHLFSMDMPNQLFRSIRGVSSGVRKADLITKGYFI